jgi:hypothetical protein
MWPGFVTLVVLSTASGTKVASTMDQNTTLLPTTTTAVMFAAPMMSL